MTEKCPRSPDQSDNTHIKHVTVCRASFDVKQTELHLKKRSNVTKDQTLGQTLGVKIASKINIGEAQNKLGILETTVRLHPMIRCSYKKSNIFKLIFKVCVAIHICSVFGDPQALESDIKYVGVISLHLKSSHFLLFHLRAVIRCIFASLL